MKWKKRENGRKTQKKSKMRGFLRILWQLIAEETIKIYGQIILT